MSELMTDTIKQHIESWKKHRTDKNTKGQICVASELFLFVNDSVSRNAIRTADPDIFKDIFGMTIVILQDINTGRLKKRSKGVTHLVKMIEAVRMELKDNILSK